MVNTCEECKVRPASDGYSMCGVCYDFFMTGDITTSNTVDKRNEDTHNVIIQMVQDSISSASLKKKGTIESVGVVHNMSDGKNEIEVKVNDETVFKYDSTKKGRIVNHIQEVDIDE
jgi:hypothetical protein